MIPDHLKNKIKEDNLKLILDIKEYKYNNILRTAFDEYHKRFEYINEMSRKCKQWSQSQKLPPPTIHSFCVFLKSQTQINS